MDMSQYLEIFTEETKEHLQGLNQCLLQLEKSPEDSSMLNEIFRVAHTLKGMSGTMGFHKMSKLTHDMENVLHALRNNEIEVSPKVVDVLFKCLDALENYLNEIISTSSEGNNGYAEIIDELNRIINKNAEPKGGTPIATNSGVGQAANEKSRHITADFTLNQYELNVVNRAIETGMNAYKITILLSHGCVLKSARSFIIFQTIEKYSEVIKAQPKVEDIEDEKFDFEFTVVVISKEDTELLVKELNSISEVDEVIAVHVTLGQAQQGASNSSEQEAEAGNKSSSSLEAESNGQAKENGEAAKAPQQSQAVKTNKTVRVDIDRLDNLMNLVSELIIIKTRLDGISKTSGSENNKEVIEYLERVTTNLHDAVMKVRMVPVEVVFNRFPRMIRDISKNINKEIVLEMSGEETELDRTVIDEIGDPLIHLLRNSADHGIESLDKRRELGKPEAGHIKLKAYQDGNNVVIEVGDDGSGIDVEKIRKKVVEKGLVNKDAAKNLSQKEVIDFLFRPSFSTADKITDLSGRGVGLDVVKTKIESLGGMVEVETEIGKGSRFIIRLPLTLAIIQALLVLIGDEKYAIPLGSIREIVKVPLSEIKTVQQQEVILIRNTVVPIVRVGEKLNVPNIDYDKKFLHVVIVKKGDRLSGFLVDSLIGQQEIVIKSLGKLLYGIKTIAGATILGDGNVALILDVNSLAI